MDALNQRLNSIRSDEIIKKLVIVRIFYIFGYFLCLFKEWAFWGIFKCLFTSRTGRLKDYLELIKDRLTVYFKKMIEFVLKLYILL